MDKNITIYTTPSCGFCKMTKNFFKEVGLNYKEIDVSSDENAANYIVGKSNQLGVPVTIFNENSDDETLVVGFERDKLEEVLGIS